MIPYEKYQSSTNVILVHEGFAHLSDFNRLSESYEFDAAFVLHPESLVMGNEATLLVRPKLTLNQRRCDAKLMENNTITLTTISFVDNIPVTKNFDNLKLDNNNELSVEFQVPPNLASVDVRFQCDVRNITMGTTEKLSRSQSYNISTNTSNAKYYEAFLRRFKGEYHYYALGKNGEPLKNVSVNFTFYHSIHSTEQKSASLYTDRDGKVNLGSLENIYKVDSRFTSAYGDCYRNWNIPHYKEVIDYPSNLEILEDENIEMPIPGGNMTVNDISLVKYSENGTTIKDCYSNCKFELLPGHGFGNLTISELIKGTYKLEIKKLNISIDVTVHEGVYWETEGFIQKKNSIISSDGGSSRFLRVSHVKISEEGKGDDVQSKLKFKLSDTNEDTRAHVYAFTYLPNQSMEGYKGMNRITKSYASSSIFPFTLWQNVYQSNRKLGDEYRYVFNRKNAKRFIGNTLEKPQLIMKRLKVRDTGFDQEVVRDGGAYGSIRAEKEFAMRSKKIAAKDYYGGGGRGGYHQDNIERIL